MAYPYQSYQNPYQQGYYPMYQQPQYQQPIQQVPQNVQTQQPVQPTVYSNGIIWVGNEHEAEMFPVGPNNAVALWESSGKRAYMKKADATGKPTMTVYDLVERSEAVESNEKPDGKTDEYAKKSDLAAVVGVVKGFDELLGSLKSDIDTMKSDMYGIAGKKKAKKPVEVVEDDE